MELAMVFLCSLLLMMVLLGGRSCRYYFIERQSANWPSTQAIIQKCEAEFHGPMFSLWATKIPKSLFGYSYEVEPVRHIGFFAIERDIGGALGVAWDIQKKLDGKSLIVRYDPKHPNRSFVADREVFGKQVHQGPDWLPFSLST
jgi:hypothetical protein